MTESIKIGYSKVGVIVSIIILSTMSFFVYKTFQGVQINVLLAAIWVLLAVRIVYRAITFWMPLFKGHPAVELTPDAIIDHINKREVPWKDIESMNYRTANTPGGNIVILNVKDPKSYYSEKLFGGLRYWVNKIYDGYPMAIRTNYLEIGAQPLFEQISEYFDTVVGK